MASTEKIKFGEAVKRLEEIVKQLEGDEIALEESCRLFEEGTKLAQLCSQRLQETEEKISRLIKDSTGKIAIRTVETDNE